jgi:glycosyltransferase involved in cell wall biosynthesis
MIILSHPTGNANVRAAVNGLVKENLLSEFHTSIAAFTGTVLHRMGAFRPLSEIRRRQFDSRLKPVTRTWPTLEIGRLMATKMGLSGLVQHEKGAFCIDAVYKNLDKHTAVKLKRATGAIHAVYAYEDGAETSFYKAKKLNLQCFYDLPIGYWRAAQRLLKKEMERWPDWASTLTGFEDSDNKLSRKDEELRLADRIFVASQFTAQTLKDFPGTLAPVEIIPYGFPPVNCEPKSFHENGPKPLKLLFVGGLSQRKGIADLFAAVEKFGKHVQLTVVGRKTNNNCPSLDKALTKHRWIPSIANSEVIKLMRQSDVLVFPSLFEGFGLVITEAMSQGTPVITTERTIGPDIIKSGENGWIVEAGSTNALQLAIEKLIGNKRLIEKVGSAALETARLRPWDVYGNELALAIKKHLSFKN